MSTNDDFGSAHRAADGRYTQRPFVVRRVEDAYVTVRELDRDGPLARCVELVLTHGGGRESLDAVMNSKEARELAATIIAMCDAIDAGES